MFSFQNISYYQQQLTGEETTCAAAVEYYLHKINGANHLNAFVEVYAEEARARAAYLDEQRKNGQPLKKLHGVVIAIKDVICYKDHHVTAASAILKNFQSLYTATALQYLIDEEAIIIGNCNCDEFAMGSSNENSVYGNVLNALDQTKVPGGSSGGSAVAVQAGLCMLSLGSDTGGSVRQPADFCGIIGFKPGYGRISRYGLIAYASSFDQIGIFGTNIPDIALLLSVMSRQDRMDSTMDQSPVIERSAEVKKTYSFCLFNEVMEHPSLDPEIKKGIELLATKLEGEGHSIKRISFNLIDHIVPAYYVLTTAEASSNLSRYDGVRYGHRSSKPTTDLEQFYRQNRSEGFGAEVKRRIMLGTFVLSTGYYDAYFQKAQEIRRLLVNQVNEIFAEVDAILMPTVPATAFPLGQDQKDPLATYLADIFTVFANLTGIPGISLPLFSHSNNMPFGVQVMTNKQDELTLFDISAMLMQHKMRATASNI
ncbi:MAG: aspartyl-tRNA(Asn) amidotransferase subunit [Ferruginibacter sp.]|nr:aspartyl-tRNA(Asn) amidotransferase subunit [Ferruginibacter sp.]